MVISPGLLWLSGCEGSTEKGAGYKSGEGEKHRTRGEEGKVTGRMSENFIRNHPLTIYLNSTLLDTQICV